MLIEGVSFEFEEGTIIVLSPSIILAKYGSNWCFNLGWGKSFLKEFNKKK